MKGKNRIIHTQNDFSKQEPAGASNKRYPHSREHSFQVKKENKSLIPPLVGVVKAWGTLKYVGSGGVREAIHTYI